MRYGKLTRDQAIEIAGAAKVDEVDAKNCDFTNRLQTDGDEAIEFSASVSFEDADGDDCSLTAFYYQFQEDLDGAGDDLSNCDWVIAGYEVR